MATLEELLGKDLIYPDTQEINPVNAQLGYTMLITPQITSGLPTTTINITQALVAEVIKANPMVKENFTYVFGMGSAMVAMPRVGRNVFELTASIFNANASCSGIYSFINLLSVANSLILCVLELENASTTNPVRISMRNTGLYQRPAVLGCVAGAVEAQEIVEPITFLGSMDWANSMLGDGEAGMLGTLSNILGVANQLGGN